MAHASTIAALKDFFESDDNSEYFCFQEGFDEPSDDSDVLMLSINGQFDFVLNLANMEVTSEEPKLKEWSKRVNTFTQENKNATAMLKHATKVCTDLNLISMQDDSDEDDAAVFVPVTQAAPKTDWKEEQEFDTFVKDYEKRGLINPGNKQAATRILSDLKHLRKSDRKYGFWAEPKTTNLFQWDVTFFDFDKDTPLYKDVQEYKKRTGKDHLEFSLEFPPSYPFAPPFIRAVRPRFQFHTGHITIGGSVCMQLLTASGWTAANSIESVLISIRAEITSGGGRLDLSNTADYTEGEARAAFQRVAQHHGWEK
jgi:ubiquitin-conjugating enzyme E2 Q